MERLIPLLNERHNLEWVLGSSRDNGDYLFVKGDKDNKFFEESIISKKFGFIKWLVENDKIDRENWGLLDNCMSEFDRYPISFDNKKLNDKAVDMLLMLLSISDTPIEDLILYLK